MTEQKAAAPPITNGAGEIPTPPPLTVEERLVRLEITITNIAGALAGLLAKEMQPQVQQAILAQLTGQNPPPAT